MSRITVKAAQIALVAALGFLGAKIPEHLIFSETDSLNKRFFIKSSGSIEKGGYATFEAPDAIKNRFKGIDKPLIKKVSCVSGEVVTLKYNSFFCNEKFLALAPRNPEDQQIIKAFLGEIPKNHFYATGDHINSVDSRFFGLVSTVNAQKAIGVF